MASINFEFLHDDDDGDRREEDSDGNQGNYGAFSLSRDNFSMIFIINHCGPPFKSISTPSSKFVFIHYDTVFSLTSVFCHDSKIFKSISFSGFVSQPHISSQPHNLIIV